MTLINNPQPFPVAVHEAAAPAQHSSRLARAWRRVQYPAGPYTRRRLYAWRDSNRHGW